MLAWAFTALMSYYINILILANLNIDEQNKENIHTGATLFGFHWTKVEKPSGATLCAPPPSKVKPAAFVLHELWIKLGNIHKQAPSTCRHMGQV